MELMARGNYIGKLVEAGTDVMGQNDTPYFYLSFEITQGQDEFGGMVEVEPFKRDVRFWLSEKAQEGTAKKLATLGFNGDYANPVFNPELYESTNLICSHRPDGDKVYEDWSIEGMNGQRERKPLNADQLRLLNAKFKQFAGLFKESPKTKQPQPQTTGPLTGDAIPY